MGEAALKPGEHYTYGDYRRWEDGERWELIEGVAYNMSPAPMRRHQRISAKILTLFGAKIEELGCFIFHASFDVRLPEGNREENEIHTVVQPDLVVYCDSSKLDEKGALGAPDLVVEILSPSTLKKDLTIKRELYESMECVNTGSSIPMKTMS